MGTAVVLGGGISGLSAAYYLSRLCQQSVSPFRRVLLYEGSGALGGWVQSLRWEDGAVYELGPNSIRCDGKPRGVNTLRLCEDLGLAPEVLPVTSTHPAAATRYVQVHGKLYPLTPQGLTGICYNCCNINPLRLLWEERKKPAAPSHLDETVHEFASRRLHRDLADYLFDPLCHGIYAGDSRRLSLRSALPDVYEIERKYGSICGALANMMFSRPQPQAQHSPEDDVYTALCDTLGDDMGARISTAMNSPPPSVSAGAGPGPGQDGEVVERSRRESWAMWSLRGGLRTLPERLGEVLAGCDPVEVHTDTPVTGLTFTTPPHTVGEGSSDQQAEAHITLASGEVVTAQHVFSALPAHQLARILSTSPTSPTSPTPLITALDAIESVTVALVHLEYEGHLPTVPKGFGYLIPSREGSNLLGVIFSSQIFPELSRQGGRGGATTRILCMMGGAWFRELFGPPEEVEEERLLELALSNFSLGSRRPCRHHVAVQRRCIPQYEVGHAARCAAMSEHVTRHRLPLSLLGASYNGVSVNDCIYNTKLAVMDVVGRRYQQRNVT